MDLYLLFESASGYGLFQKSEFEQIGAAEESVQEAMLDAKKFGKAIQLKAFLPFSTAEEALEQQNAVANGEASELLMSFLDQNLPKCKNVNKPKYHLGVSDVELGRALAHAYPTQATEAIKEMLRCCRIHFSRSVKNLSEQDQEKARLGLAHTYSRSKMQLDPNRQDKPIINAIALLDSLDKNINTFAMRVKEWYAWHFPELTKIVTDNIVYAKVAQHIGIRDNWTGDAASLAEVTGSEEVAEEILKAMKTSMGQDIVEIDWNNINTFAGQVIRLAALRESLATYLTKKMMAVAPNLCTLIGERVGARLISHAGSLTNLAKFPASTVQILGAEKALFRALKTKGNTPKYGLIFHSTFIGRAAQKNKGRISRYLANKASLSSRIDCFSTTVSGLFGEKMKEQVEERLTFLTEGTQPRKNADVMKEAMKELGELEAAVAKKSKKEKKAKKAKKAEAEEVVEEAAEEEAPKKEKKEKKNKRKAEDEEVVEEEPAKKKSKKEKKAKKEE